MLVALAPFRGTALVVHGRVLIAPRKVNGFMQHGAGEAAALRRKCLVAQVHPTPTLFRSAAGIRAFAIRVGQARNCSVVHMIALTDKRSKETVRGSRAAAQRRIAKVTARSLDGRHYVVFLVLGATDESGVKPEGIETLARGVVNECV